MLRTRALLCALALLTMSARARAGNCDAPETSGCVDSDTLWPHAGPRRFVAVGGTETVAPGDVTFGLMLGWQSRPVVLKLASPGGAGSEQAAIDNQLTSTFLFGYGVTSRLELDAAIPVTLLQNGVGLQPITGGQALRDTVARDLRFGATYAIVPRARVTQTWADPSRAMGAGRLFSLAARFEVSAPTGEKGQQMATDRGAVFIPSLSTDFRYKRFFGGLEFGARLRETGALLGARIGSQLVLSLGAGVDILPRELLSFGIEARALPGFDQQLKLDQGVYVPSGKSFVPAEWMASVRTAPLAGGDLAIQLGGGGALPLGDVPVTVPRFRFVLSVVFAPLGHDSDGDGIEDREDQCPGKPGPASSGLGRGCPSVNKP
jgi:hypothetical protein